MKHIVTHNGGAHADEMLAAALLVAADPSIIRIERKPAAEAAELEGSHCYVLDIGGRHEPQKLNFDHHQFNPEAEPRCTLTLVLEHLNKTDQARRFWPWLGAFELGDVKGPEAVAQDLGIPPAFDFDQLSSPLEEGLLSAFSDSADLAAGEPLFEGLRLIGQHLMRDLEACSDAIDWLKQSSRIQALSPGQNALVLEAKPDMNPMVFRRVLRVCRRTIQPDVMAYAGPDPRGPGWVLMRFPGGEHVDFRRLEGEPAMSFIHASGFLATTRARVPTEQLLALASRAISAR